MEGFRHKSIMDEKRINLFDLLVELSGLDRNVIDQELGVLIQKLKLDPKNLSVDDIRHIAALYLFEVQSSTENDMSLHGALAGERVFEIAAEA